MGCDCATKWAVAAAQKSSLCGDSTFSQLAELRSAPGLHFPVTETRQKSFQKRELLFLEL